MPRPLTNKIRTNTTFAKLVQKKCKESGVTWEQLFEETLQLSNSHSRSIKNGTKRPSLDLVSDVAAALRVGPKRLIGNDPFECAQSSKIRFACMQVIHQAGYTAEDLREVYKRADTRKKIREGQHVSYKTLKQLCDRLLTTKKPIDLIEFI